MKALQQDLEKQRERAGQLYDINEREREVMFQCIHKVSEERENSSVQLSSFR